MKPTKEITKDMARRIKAHYLAQGVTETDIQIVPDEFGGALSHSVSRRDHSAIWRIWKGGNGFAFPARHAASAKFSPIPIRARVSASFDFHIAA